MLEGGGEGEDGPVHGEGAEGVVVGADDGLVGGIGREGEREDGAVGGERGRGGDGDGGRTRADGRRVRETWLT